jgi:hypothetical protein
MWALRCPLGTTSCGSTRTQGTQASSARKARRSPLYASSSEPGAGVKPARAQRKPLPAIPQSAIVTGCGTIPSLSAIINVGGIIAGKRQILTCYPHPTNEPELSFGWSFEASMRNSGQRTVPRRPFNAKALNPRGLGRVPPPDLLSRWEGVRPAAPSGCSNTPAWLRRYYDGTATALLRHHSHGHRDAHGSGAVAVPL